MKKMTFKKILNIAFYLLVIFLTSYLVFDFIAPDKTVSIFGFKTYVVDSPSMEPTLNVNDAIVVIKTKETKINAGDIITFKVYLPDLGSEGYVTHYVEEIITSEDTIIYKTQGEDSETDEWEDSEGNPIDISGEDIIGRVSFKISGAGHVIKILRDPIMVLLLAVNIAVVVFIVYYIKKQKNIGNLKKPSEEDSLE